MEGHWKFLGGGGVLKAKFLEEMYENKLKFPGGGGAKQKTFRGGSMDIFWNCTLVKEIPKSESSKTKISTVNFC